MDCSRFLLVTDVDGTLLDHHAVLSPRNKEKIETFMQLGGGFCIASGRSRMSVQHVLEQTGLHVNRPCILINGSLLYDYEKGEETERTPLPPTAREVMEQVLDRFPQVGAEVFLTDGIVPVRDNDLLVHHRKYEEPADSFVERNLRTAPWGKLLFAVPPEKMGEVERFFQALPHSGMKFVASCDHYYEVMAEQADKGAGVRALSRRFGYRRENIAAIGDYFNDVEMLGAAGIPAVPGNAPDAMKRMFPHVLCRCEDGAVGELIEELMARCERDG